MTMSTPHTNRYQQWKAGGSKYHKGLSLFNEVKGFTTLKKTLGRGPSPYNTGKLDAALKKAFDVPAHEAPPRKGQGERAKAKGERRETGRHAHAPAPTPEQLDNLERVAQDASTDDAATSSTQSTEGEGGKDGDDGTGSGDDEDDPRDEPTEYTPRTWKARPFSELPEPLKQLRIGIIRDYRTRAAKHAELRAHPARKEDRQLLCRAIVEITDRINAHWAIEETWTKGEGLPHLPEDEEQRIANADVFQLQRELANQVNPQLTRINVKLRGDLDEEERTAAEMRKGALEHTKALIKARLLAYQEQVKR